jgi:hypothetical protein
MGTVVISFGAFKPPAHPVDGDGVSSRTSVNLKHFEAAISQRKFHGISLQCSVNYCLEMMGFKATGRRFTTPFHVKINYIKLFQSIQPL